MSEAEHMTNLHPLQKATIAALIAGGSASLRQQISWDLAQREDVIAVTRMPSDGCGWIGDDKDAVNVPPGETFIIDGDLSTLPPGTYSLERVEDCPRTYRIAHVDGSASNLTAGAVEALQNRSIQHAEELIMQAITGPLRGDEFRYPHVGGNNRKERRASRSPSCATKPGHNKPPVKSGGRADVRNKRKRMPQK